MTLTFALDGYCAEISVLLAKMDGSTQGLCSRGTPFNLSDAFSLSFDSVQICLR